MRIELDILPRAYLGICWRYRCRRSRRTITCLEIKIGRLMWDRMRVTTDETQRLRDAAKRFGSAIDRLDLRTPYGKEIAAGDARAAEIHAKLSVDFAKFFEIGHSPRPPMNTGTLR